jgi:fatty-acyl-CoA synthase
VTEADLLEYAKAHIHERAAHPKHLEILDELPKTAVGKIFKPDLRKRAIARVYDKALTDEGVAAHVETVTEDKKLGLVANITGSATPDQISAVLSKYTVAWSHAD